MNKKTGLIFCILLLFMVFSGCSSTHEAMEKKTSGAKNTQTENKKSKSALSGTGSEKTIKPSPGNESKADANIAEDFMDNSGAGEANTSGNDTIDEAIISFADSTYKLVFMQDKKLSAEAEGSGFNSFAIYKTGDQPKKLFEFKNSSYLENGSFTAYETGDRNKDGKLEFYFIQEDMNGNKYLLILGENSGSVSELFYGFSLDYGFEDYDNDGQYELFCEQSNGGGYVSYWTGFSKAYKLVNGKYTTSFDITRNYYMAEEQKALDALSSDKTPENLVGYLNALADLGLGDEIKKCIDENQDMVKGTKFDYSAYYDGPDETFFDFVTRRAEEYKNVWKDYFK